MSTFKTKISRETAAGYGRQAVRITESGEYIGPSGRVVDVSQLVKRSVDGTVSYPPGQRRMTDLHTNLNDVLNTLRCTSRSAEGDRSMCQSPALGVRGRLSPESASENYQTKISVENITTLEAARRLIAEGRRPAVLNFASATNPGGGFLGGARAQEEYLARSSGLYACIRDNAMYAFHRSRRDPLYTNYAIYSPDVPVFRSDDGSLLDEPYTVGIITCPAVNAGKTAPERRCETGPAMWLRILKVLSIGVKHAHDSIVLGAWGCGAFGNDGREIAELFHRALEQNFKGGYRQVVFAIVDWSRDRRFIGPFQEAFRAN